MTGPFMINFMLWHMSVGLCHTLNCTSCYIYSPVTMIVAMPNALNKAHLQAAGKAAALKPASYAMRVSVIVRVAESLGHGLG